MTSTEPTSGASSAARVQTRISVSEPKIMVNLLGAKDEILRLIERTLVSDVHVRGNEITLTDRERDVLKFICMEFTAQEIAQKMEISPRTVEAIKDRLMERFGSKNTAGLVFFAVKNNLID